MEVDLKRMTIIELHLKSDTRIDYLMMYKGLRIFKNT